MKTTTLPPLRVKPSLRKEAKAVLEKDEALSAFMLEAITRHIEYRKVQHDFLVRGLASAAKARRTGHYVSAEKVLAKLEKRLDKAREKTA